MSDSIDSIYFIYDINTNSHILRRETNVSSTSYEQEPVKQNIKIYRGDTFEGISFQWLEEDESVISLDGYSAKMQLRTINDELIADYNSGDGNLEINDHDEVVWTLTSEQASQLNGTYYYDLQITKNTYVRTLAKGQIIIEKDQTR